MAGRTATAVLQARGAFEQNPERKRIHEPEADKPLEKVPPDWMTEEQQATWLHLYDVASHLPGVLMGSDAVVFDIASQLYHEFKQDFMAMSPSRIGQLRNALGQLGLTPVDRSRLMVNKKDKNDFDALK